MRAEIIAVGTELLLGQVVNTDATIVAKGLSQLGIDLLHSSVVGDNPSRLENSLQLAFSRSELVILTGGLGPTQDDLTKETVAKVAMKKLVLDIVSLERIAEIFNSKTLADSQKKQAMLPEGSTVFQNDFGTAPGCIFKTSEEKLVMMLPGPPSELAPMFHHYAMKYLEDLQNAVIVSHTVHVFGLGEAYVAREMDDLIANSNPTVAPYAKEGEMYLRITAKAGTEHAAENLIIPMITEIKDRIGDCVYGEDTDSLEEVVVRELTYAKMKIATAESCTGGLLAKRITDVPGASKVFEMGLITYANAVKEELLGVPSEILKQHGAVSEQTASFMAEQVLKKAKSHLAIGITGIAGPDGGTDEKPVGLIYIALSDGKTTWVMKSDRMRQNRDKSRLYAASQALDMVRRYLAGLPILSDKKILP